VPGYTCFEAVPLREVSLAKARRELFIPDSEIRTADSTDFTDFEEVIGHDLTNLFVAKLQGIADRNLLFLCNLRNLWLNPFKSVSVFGLMRS